MDGLAIAALCKRWNAQFQRARIDKIHQPAPRDLVLTVRSHDGTHRLLLSAHKMFARAHELFRQKPVNPEEPPMFCMLIRKRIEGGRIVEIRQSGWDRVIEIHVEALDDIGDRVSYVLVVEVMGKHSNIVLCQALNDGRPGRIVDSVVHVTKEMSRFRQVYPGQMYVSAPPQEKKDFQTVTTADVAALNLENLTEKQQRLVLCGLVAGMGPLTAGEILFRTGPNAASRPNDLCTEIQTLFADTLASKEPVSVGLDELGIPTTIAPYELKSWAQHHLVNSLDEGLDSVYLEAAARSQVTALAADLEHSLMDQVDKLRGKRTKLVQELELSQDHHHYRICGELLTAYAYQVTKGQTEVALPNFYDEERPLNISLDPALTALENARAYFKQGSKRKRAIPMLESEIEQTEADLRYLEETLVHLKDASRENIQALYKELEQQGFVKAKRLKANRNKPAAPTTGQPDTYLSVDGLTIRVGRNNVQNDRLTLKSSQGYDVWLHTKDVPGSHVVISTDKREVPETTLHEAAILAAYFSKGRDSTNVGVDYTLIRHVWKPNGARPGFVLYDHQKTLFVNPDRQQIEELTRRRGH